MPKVDAIRFPRGWDPGFRTGNRLHEVLDYCEPHLGAKGYIRSVGEEVLVTADPADGLLFPPGHKLGGQPRYDWQRQPDGCEFGTLRDDPSAPGASAGPGPQPQPHTLRRE
jgi:hypothetical protein